MIFIYRISFCLFYLWSLTVHAEVHIKITTGVDSARPIGIVPFKLSGLDIVPENISDIITNDLYNSGQFNPIDKSYIPEQPTVSSEVTPEVWRKLGIYTVIVGQIEPSTDDSYIVFYQLVDTSSKTGVILGQNKYKVKKNGYVMQLMRLAMKCLKILLV